MRLCSPLLAVAFASGACHLCDAAAAAKTGTLLNRIALAIIVSAVQGYANKNKVCDLTDRGTSFDFGDPDLKDCEFMIFHPSFASMLLPNPSLDLRMDEEEPIFHEGPVLWEDKLFFTTNRLGNTTLGNTNPAQLDQYIDIYQWDVVTGELIIVDPYPQDIPMPNGMTLSGDGQRILALSQGFDTTGAAIYEMDPSTYEAKVVLNSFYGAPFNSFNDIEITGDDEIIFFSDPVYGFQQGFRAGKPLLGSNIYRYDRTHKKVDIVSAEFQRPNGLALLDERSEGGGCTLYLTDSGFEVGGFTPRGFQGFGDSAVYELRDPTGCFEPISGPWVAQPLMPVVKHIQDGIQVHAPTKLLVYCDGSGAWVWSIPMYQPIGLIKCPCTQVIFAQEVGVQTLYILQENRLYSTELNFDESLGSHKGGITAKD